MVKAALPVAPRPQEEFDHHAAGDRHYQGDVARAIEYPDSTPMEPPVGYEAQPSMFEVLRAQARAQAQADMLYEESFEEADDFVIGDDFDPSTPYEEFFIGSIGSFDTRFSDVVKDLNDRLQKAKAEAQKKTTTGQDSPPSPTQGTRSSRPPASPPSRGERREPRETLDGPDEE